MKASEAKLLDLLKKSPQFVIPIYQRTYSWTETECRQLWEDIIRAGSNPNVADHFIGSIVYVEKGLSQLSSQSPVLVIDGQQRLTTVTLLLAALADALGDSEPVEGFSARKLRYYYLLNDMESGERRYKLILSQTDKASLIAAVAQHAQPHAKSLRVTANLEEFRQLIAARKGDLVPVCNGIAKLVIVDVALNREHDNPQLIFESMNSTGRELSQADLIRNYILMGLEHNLQSDLYEQYWRPMEVEFGQEAYGLYFDAFMRHFLTVKTGGDIPNVQAVYEAFKKHARAALSAGHDVKALVSDLRTDSSYLCAMALDKETNPSLKSAFRDLRELKVDVAYPFLLELYRDYDEDALSKSEFVEVVRLVEAYVFRRAVCAIPTNSMNKTFATFGKEITQDRYLESVKAHFLQLPSYRRFPNDDEFQRNLKTRDLYNFGTRRSYWLRRLENHGGKEYVPVEDYTIEHILPQNPNLSPAWKQALGLDWQRIQKTWLHTLGNLTLTGYNSEYGDCSFAEKRDRLHGFRDSPVRLNQSLRHVEQWNEAAIAERAEELAQFALAAWPRPSLSLEALASYAASPESSEYTLADFPTLASGSLHELFEAFRKEVQALDPCVTEEITKGYVAFRAEYTFVAVLPRVAKLALDLKIPFNDLVDSRKVAKDISNATHPTNVRVTLARHDELAHIIGLVRQALDRQLGNGAEAQ